MTPPDDTHSAFATGAADVLWDRHANPISGWTRLLSYPVLLATLYARRWKLFALTVAFVAVNPVLFPAPEEPSDDWMYRVVRAEQRWQAEGRPFVGLGYPEVLSLVNVPVSLYAFAAAVRRKPVGTAVGGALTMLLKLWFVAELVRRVEAEDRGAEAGNHGGEGAAEN